MTIAGSIAIHGNRSKWRIVTLRSFLARMDRSGRVDLPLLGVNLHSGVRLRGDGDGRPAASEDLRQYKVVAPGDIIMNRLGKPHGSVGLSHLEGITSPAYWVLRVNRDVAEPRFMHYLLRSRHMIAEYERLGKYMPPNQFDLAWDQFRSVRIPLPSLEEQRRIADFLDTETARIDDLSELVGRTLRLVQERRTLNVLHLIQPVGAAPPCTVPLKYMASRVTVGIVITPAKWYVDGDGVIALRGLNIKPGLIDPADIVRISHEGHELYRKSKLRAGDIVVVRTGQAGTAAVVPDGLGEANCIDLVIVRPMPDVNPKYLEIVLNSEFARQYISESSVGSIQSHLNVSAMKQLPIPRRDTGEQAAVVAAVQELDRVTDHARSLMQRQIELLAERRQALITASVTGQFDVATGRGADLS